MTALEIFEKLRELGAHTTDITDALHAADPDWAKRYDEEVLRRRALKPIAGDKATDASARLNETHESGQGGAVIVRSRGRFVMLTIGGLMMFAVGMSIALIGNGPDNGIYVFAVAFMMIGIVLIFGMARVRVVCDMNGVLVRNSLYRRRVAWADFDHFELGQKYINPWIGLVVRKDGSSSGMAAVQAPQYATKGDPRLAEAQAHIDDLNAAATRFRSGQTW